MRTVKFTIYGPPLTKGRPRVTVRNGFAHAYTPAKTVEYENLIRMSFITELPNTYLKGPLKADFLCCFPVPKSVSKKKAQQMLDGVIKYTKKPDADNISKTILDALNKVAYDDDSQVYDVRSIKVYSDKPRVEVTITEEDE